MFSIDLWFVFICKFSLVVLVMLVPGALTLRYIKQPIERIRLIQISLLVALAAAFLAQTDWRPKIEIPVLPAATVTQADMLWPSEMITRESSVVQHQDQSTRAFQPNMDPAARVANSRNVVPTELTTNVSGDAGSVSSAVVKPSGFSRLAQLAKTLLVIGVVSITLLQALLLVAGLLATRRLVAQASPPADSRIRRMLDEIMEPSPRGERGIRLLVSDRISVPIATGLLRPAIILPASLMQADPVRIRHSMAHEWKHIQRNDLITWRLVSVCQLLFWPQPVFWMMRRELRVSQDQIADQVASYQNDEQVAYATTLVEFSRARHAPVIGALTMAGTRSNLYRRIEMLLDQKFQLAGISRKRVVGGFACVLAAASLLTISLQLTHAATPEADLSTDDLVAVEQENEQEEKAKPAPATEPVEHTGFVLNAVDQTPVVGATVICTRMNSKLWEEIAVTESVTDADGKYTITIPPEQLNEKYLYIMFDLRHESFAPRHCGSYSYSMIKKNLKLGDPPWFTKLTMLPGKKISAQVIDPDGKPVADAAIRVSSQGPGGQGDFSNSSSSKTTTDQEGRFEAVVTAEGPAKFSVIPMDHCIKHVDAGTKRGDLGQIELSEGVSISGTLLDAVGKPIEGLWVNVSEEERNEFAAYDAKRSSQTDQLGEFQTRPLKPGKYTVKVETKATGALEKERYANFKDDPPEAVFVDETIEVTEDSSRQPFVIQAVPHVFIQGQGYNSKDEITGLHLPSIIGSFKGKSAWIHSAKGDQKGSFVLKVPHGFENARLSFLTNEHSALRVQIGDKQPTPQTQFTFEKLEEDITDIKVTRYVAPILQVKVVNEAGEPFVNPKDKSTGNELPQGYGPDILRVKANYQNQPEVPKNEMMMSTPYEVYFEKQTNGVFRSSSLVPGIEVQVYAELDGYESERRSMTMDENGEQVITLTLKPSPKKDGGQ